MMIQPSSEAKFAALNKNGREKLNNMNEYLLL